MALFFYQCKHCEILIKKESTPNGAGCTGKSKVHAWTKLGEVGNVNYNCSRCGVTVEVKSQPVGAGCPSNALHSWTKL